MSIKKKIKKIIKLFKAEKLVPVYIPMYNGECLKDKTVLITGATGGIGKAIAKACLANGATVIISGRNEETLDKVKNELSSCGNERIFTLKLDINSVSSIEAFIAEIVGKNGIEQIDVLVNNAGAASHSHVGNTKEDEYDMVLGANLKGTYFMAQEFANYFVKNKIKGNILNISSVSGIRPANSPYMVSKWGITGLTKGLAKQLIQYDIVVNGIAPGPTLTNMINHSDSGLEYDKSPAKRYLDAAEVANLAVFLISEMGRMIVGETIAISGGCGNLTYDDIKY